MGGADPALEPLTVGTVVYKEGDARARRGGLPRYEYKTLWWVNRIKGMTIDTLNALGDQGWHVVGSNQNWLILERPKLWQHNQYLSCCQGSPCCDSCLSSCSAPRETE